MSDKDKGPRRLTLLPEVLPAPRPVDPAPARPGPRESTLLRLSKLMAVAAAGAALAGCDDKHAASPGTTAADASPVASSAAPSPDAAPPAAAADAAPDASAPPPDASVPAPDASAPPPDASAPVASASAPPKPPPKAPKKKKEKAYFVVDMLVRPARNDKD